MRNIIIFILSLNLFNPSLAHGKTLKSILQFASGFTCGLLAHEAAHIVVAEAKGIDLRFQGLDFTYGKASKSVTLAGFTEQIISSELILHSKTRHPFWIGYLVFNIIEPPVALIRASSESSCFGDLVEIERHGINKNTVGIVINLHAAYTLYRVLKRN